MATPVRQPVEPVPRIADPPRVRPRPSRPDDAGWHGERPWPAFARTPGRSESDFFHHEKSDCSVKLVKHEARMILAGVIVATLVGALIAGLIVPFVFGQFNGLAVIATTCFLAVYIGLLTLPIWMASIEDDIEDHAGFADDATVDATVG